MAAEPQQYTQRLVVLGAAGVGKSAIVAQFLFETFTEKYKKTVEELYCTEYDVYETKVRLDILDTSGSFEFPAMRKLSITNANAYLLVYAIDNPQSFEEIKSIRQEIIDIRGEAGIAQLPVVVVGNKCDMEDKRQVPKEDAELVVELAWQHVFLESSAKERTNVVNIFKQLLHQAHIPCHLSPALRRRRASLPVTPSANGHASPGGKDDVKPSMRRHNTRRRSSCKVQ
ncbi:ras-related protein Rap-2a-like [Branchiostoma lanceolatum]|uniref:ras-related protein Rap-2a-like n=1 Tax=Branchiostoma lanceolatum TaxID=7740 RepID=UPI003454CCC6